MDLTALLSFLSSHVLELVTLVVSLFWLYLEYRASIWLWPVGIILPCYGYRSAIRVISTACSRSISTTS